MTPDWFTWVVNIVVIIGVIFSIIIGRDKLIIRFHIPWHLIKTALPSLRRLALVLLVLFLVFGGVLGGVLVVQGVRAKGPLAFLGLSAPTPASRATQTPKVTITITLTPPPTLPPTATATSVPTSPPVFNPTPTPGPQMPWTETDFGGPFPPPSNQNASCSYDPGFGPPPYTFQFSFINKGMPDKVTISWYLSSITDNYWSVDVTSGSLAPGDSVIITAVDSTHIYQTGEQVTFWFTCQPCDSYPPYQHTSGIGAGC